MNHFVLSIAKSRPLHSMRRMAACFSLCLLMGIGFSFSASALPLLQVSEEQHFIFVLDESSLIASQNVIDLATWREETILQTLRFLRQYALLFPNNRSLSAAIVVYGRSGARALDIGRDPEHLQWFDLNQPTASADLATTGWVSTQLRDRCYLDEIGGCLSGGSDFAAAGQVIQTLLGNLPMGSQTTILVIGSGISCPDGCPNQEWNNHMDRALMSENMTNALPQSVLRDAGARMYLLLTRPEFGYVVSHMGFWLSDKTLILPPQISRNAPTPISMGDLPLSNFMVAHIMGILNEALRDPQMPGSMALEGVASVSISAQRTIGGTRSQPAAIIHVPPFARSLRILAGHPGYDSTLQVVYLPSETDTVVMDAADHVDSRTIFRATAGDPIFGDPQGWQIPAAADAWEIDNPPPGTYVIFRNRQQSDSRDEANGFPNQDNVFVQITMETLALLPPQPGTPLPTQQLGNAVNYFQYAPLPVRMGFGQNGDGEPLNRTPNGLANQQLRYQVGLCRQSNSSASHPPCLQTADSNTLVDMTFDNNQLQATLYPMDAGDVTLQVNVTTSIQQAGGAFVPYPEVHTSFFRLNQPVNPIELYVDCGIVQTNLSSNASNVVQNQPITVRLIVRSPQGLLLPSSWGSIFQIGNLIDTTQPDAQIDLPMYGASPDGVNDYVINYGFSIGLHRHLVLVLAGTHTQTLQTIQLQSLIDGSGNMIPSAPRRNTFTNQLTCEYMM